MRAEPFLLALATLRENLRTGAYPPGARLAATVIAEELRLSPTPVREALSRLAGEGLLEDRRGQGFFVRALRGDDLADLYRLHHAMLKIALDPGAAAMRVPVSGDADFPADETLDPVARTERLFSAWIATCSSPVFREAHGHVLVQLGPARRLEPLLITDLEAEADALESAVRAAERLSALRRYHQRRIQLADRLSALAERRGRLNY